LFLSISAPDLATGSGLRELLGRQFIRTIVWTKHCPSQQRGWPRILSLAGEPFKYIYERS